MKEAIEKCVDSQLWHACAGSMVQIPPLNSNIFYFPQGHAEHTSTDVDFTALPRISAMILCRVNAVKFLADPETDEIYAKIMLIPVENKNHDFENDTVLGSSAVETTEKPSSFAKTLTQSDANNGGGFSVPRYCAETIFPRLDFTAEPPVQTVIAKDVHGAIWKFRHIYRGTPRRHLLTTGWSSFVNQKKLVAGDSVVFLRAENGDLCVGIRRVKRGGIGGMELNSSGGRFRDKGQVSPESVVKAAYLAASGQRFEIVYYPRASSPEFCVRASSVNAAMNVQWCSGMRFKMAFETEDSSRISWFMGSISSVQVADPIRWPHSPWRLLQVTWDEPDLLQNVKHVSPWLVELVSNMPVIHLSHFSPPRKKLCLPQDFALDSQFPLPSFLGNPLRSSSPFCCLSDNITAGIQGARHAQFGVPLLDLQLSKKIQLGLLPPVSQPLDADSRIPNGISKVQKESNENISCLLTMGSSSQMLDKADNLKTPRFLLFGQPILTEQQMSSGRSTNVPPQVQTKRDSSGEAQMETERISLGWKGLSESLSNATLLWNKGYHAAELGMSTGHCKVFLDSEDVGHALDISVLRSYEEVYKKLADIFGLERLDMMTRVLYIDATGASRQIGDAPFSDFVKTAKRLTILKNPDNSAARKWLTDLPTAEGCLDSSNQAGSLSIFA
uniref:Auxin response factor 18 n=1 Tax=Nicotiana tabacum TaxID=4097 RepID=A0A1S4DBF1_TOBAC|nr:PREDICTED: auxin response factor 18-like [Nicotiana tabacum]XP_016510735.1 PREDICTED: auxin response factor 18-like [Nicotiana tabacum]XP_016510736.1 PREDICTED: auxin response factor 18-like [Nicotiana tabacum]